MQIPTVYQGSKQRIANHILDIINPNPALPFYDLCCGSGAISIALVERGFPAKNIHMCDSGPYGLFWKAVGDGTFDMDRLRHLCASVPKDKSLIKTWMEQLSKQPANIYTPYVFLLLQASSFGGKAIWVDNNKWQNCSFRSYWMPTATSNRRSPVNPMMPMTDTLIKRVEEICQKMLGVHAYHCDIKEISPEGTIYVDPPYLNTTHYKDEFDVVDWACKLNKLVYISEYKPLSKRAWQLTEKRAKGGISGNRTTFNEEWLSLIGEYDEELLGG